MWSGKPEDRGRLFRLIGTTSAIRCVFVILLAALPGGSVRGQVARFRESVSLNVDAQVVRALETAREHIAGNRWSEAVPLLQQQIETGGDVVVPVEAGRYVNAGTVCQEILASLSPEGLAAYRKQVDAQARDLFEAGREQFDEQPLRRIVHQFFCSSYGDDALWLLGELAFDRGNFAQARSCWQFLIPDLPTEDRGGQAVAKHLTFPDPQMAPAEVRFRLVLCSIVEGDLKRARSELAVLARLHPEDQTSLRGEQAPMVRLLQQELEAAGKQQSRSSDSGVPINGLDSSSEQQVDMTEDWNPTAVSLLWSQPLPENRFIGPTSRLVLGRPVPLATYPLIRDETVFVPGSDSIFAFDLKSGRPKWPVDQADKGEIFTNTLDRPWLPHIPLAGVAAYSLTFRDGRLYSRTGPPLTRRSRNEGNAFSEIVGLDVGSQQGRLVFHVTSDVLDTKAESPESTSWTFEGTPVIENGRVFASLRQGSPEDQTAVACFDADTGKLIWSRRVCSNLRNSPDQLNEIGHRRLTLADGRVFLATDSGAIAALDAESGRILWVVTYQSLAEETPTQMSDPLRHGLAQCLHHGGVFYAAPADSTQLFALDAATGEAVWVKTVPERFRHLLGVASGRLMASGNSLWAFDARTGEFVWPERRVGFEDPEGAGYGRGVLTAQHVYWPLHDGILKVDHESGTIVSRIELRESFGVTGGNLLISNGVLLIATSDRIVALGRAAIPDKDAPAKPTPAGPRDFGWQPLKLDTFSAAAARNPTSATTVDRSQTATSPFWPARRVWMRQLPPESRTLFSTSARDYSASGIVNFHDGQLRLLDAGTGADCWQTPFEDEPLQVAEADSLILIAAARGVQARDRLTGRFLWRRLLTETDGRFQWLRVLTDSRLLVAAERTLMILASETGRTVSFFPPSESAWTVANSFFLRRSPAAASAISITSGSRYADDAGQCFAPEGSTSVMFRPKQSGTAVLFDFERGTAFRSDWLRNDTRQLQVRTTSSDGSSPSMTLLSLEGTTLQSRTIRRGEARLNWSHRIETATFGEPVLHGEGDCIIAVEDARTALRLDAATGRILWKQNLGPFPVDDPRVGTLLFRDRLLAVSGGALHCFSVLDGRRQWTCRLGEKDWRLQMTDGAILCMTSSRRDAGTKKSAARALLAICDLESGQLIQRLPFPGDAPPLKVQIQSNLAVVLHGSDLHGLRSFAAAADERRSE